MDFTHTPYFAGAQPYQFIGIPPLTPSHSNSVASEDFNTTSPPEVYEQFPNGLPHEPFQNFDNYVQFNPQQTFPGPPTPPGQHPVVQAVNGSAHPAIPAADVLAVTKAESDEQSRRQGSNSDEDELTPAQSRRKAQNRAAQRAFRERKERHVKDLESRLQQLEHAQQQAVSENEKLKRDLQKMSTENEILRATSSVGGNAGSPGANAAPTTTGPLSYNPTDFYSNVLQHHPNKTPSHRIVTSDDGERLLAAGATWDLIINHDLFKRGLVDIADVSDRLKSQAKCDGQGPVFEERAILEAIEQSVASGSDELL
jgi:AP-1-like factor